jgi:2-(1,2-epoxy-1,2-dihydrophenyl)acetyl-CoA isomerase
MSWEHILVSTDGPVGRLTLNRPDKLNAFAGRMRTEICEGLAALEGDPAVRVVVITGAGRGFCSGADVTFLRELLENRDREAFRGLLDAGRDVVTRIRNMGVPVIASVNGAAAGGGLNLALACDLRIASEAATFGQTFARIGLAPDWGGIHFLPRLVGEAKAIELMMTGTMIDAAEALRIGLVNRVVPADRLAAETEQLAHSLAARPPLSVRAIKQGVYASGGRSLAETLGFEIESQLICFDSADAREGVAAYFEKRAPRFEGN